MKNKIIIYYKTTNVKCMTGVQIHVIANKSYQTTWVVRIAMSGPEAE